MYTYIGSFDSEIEACNYTDTLIYGGIVQKQEGKYHVWQINFQSQSFMV
jgi:hypothetical protein